MTGNNSCLCPSHTHPPHPFSYPLACLGGSLQLVMKPFDLHDLVRNAEIAVMGQVESRNQQIVVEGRGENERTNERTIDRSMPQEMDL